MPQQASGWIMRTPGQEIKGKLLEFSTSAGPSVAGKQASSIPEE